MSKSVEKRLAAQQGELTDAAIDALSGVELDRDVCRQLGWEYGSPTRFHTDTGAALGLLMGLKEYVTIQLGQSAVSVGLLNRKSAVLATGPIAECASVFSRAYLKLVSRKGRVIMARNGLELIADERQRQVSKEGWTSDRDDEHGSAEMIHAAESYLLAASYVQEEQRDAQLRNLKNKPPRFWPWASEWWKPSDEPIRNLVKAGALIAAEIDRLQRKAHQ